jgi:P27 family predicted phage terminase small subunit
MHILDGTYRGDRHGSTDTLPSSIPTMPSHLRKSSRMRQVWKEMVEVLDAEMHVLTKADRRALEIMVEAYDEYRKASDMVESEGMTFVNITESGEMIRVHPAVRIKADAWSRFQKMLSEFGMTPSSRSKVNVKLEEKIPQTTKKAW